MSRSRFSQIRDDKIYVGTILVPEHPALNIFYWGQGAPRLRKMLSESLGTNFLVAPSILEILVEDRESDQSAAEQKREK